MTLKWKTSPTRYDQTVQYTDSYVVHGRGFTIDEDIWFDQYALHAGHHSHWNEIIRHEYDLPRWEPRQQWEKYAEEIDPTVVYWSITGAPTFLIQHPNDSYIEQRHWKLLAKTLDAMAVSDDERLTLRMEDGASKQITVTEVKEKTTDENTVL